MKKYNLVIVGLDNWYHAFPIAEYCAKPNSRLYLAGASDDHPQHLEEYKQTFSVPATDSDWRQLIRQVPCDIVMVSSVSSRHEEIAVEAARMGKHIICDKPIATTYKAALNMQRAVEENGVGLAMMHNYRFSPVLMKARELIESGAIGRVTGLTFNSRAGLPEGWPGSGSPGWYAQPALAGGGGFSDHASHVIDAVMWLLDERIPTGVTGTMGRFLYPDLPSEDNGFALLDFGDCCAAVECGWTTPPGLGYSEFLQIVGEQGELFTNRAGRPYLELRQAGTGSYAQRIEMDEPVWTDILIQVIESFLDSLETGAPCRTPILQGVNTIRVLEAVYAAAALGKREIVCR